jgi:hypothetical protein
LLYYCGLEDSEYDLFPCRVCAMNPELLLPRDVLMSPNLKRHYRAPFLMDFPCTSLFSMMIATIFMAAFGKTAPVCHTNRKIQRKQHREGRNQPANKIVLKPTTTTTTTTIHSCIHKTADFCNLQVLLECRWCAHEVFSVFAYILVVPKSKKSRKDPAAAFWKGFASV